jgi:hypothetical protein
MSRQFPGVGDITPAVASPCHSCHVVRGIATTLMASVMIGALAGIAHAQAAVEAPAMMQSTASSDAATTTPSTAALDVPSSTLLQPGMSEPSHLDASIGVRAGTLGFGVEVGKLIFSHLGVRAGINFFNYGAKHSISDLDYNARLRYQNIPVLLDIFPWARGSFHLTGGVVFDQNRITGTGTPNASGEIPINGTNYTQAQVGVLSGAIRYPSTAGYAGLGFGTPARHSLVAFVADFGVMISTPKVSLNATNAGTDPQLASDLQAQQVTTQKKVNQYAKFYPVLSLGLIFRM